MTVRSRSMSTAPAPVAEESRSSHGRLGPGSARVSHARYVGWTYKYKVRYTRQLYSRDMFKMYAKSSPHRQRFRRKRAHVKVSSSRSTLNAEYQNQQALLGAHVRRTFVSMPLDSTGSRGCTRTKQCLITTCSGFILQVSRS